MNQEYQRLIKRYERIFSPQIFRAIKKQIDQYLAQGRLEDIQSDPVISVLETLYGEVGSRWGYKTDQNIRKQLGLPRLGFSQRIKNLITQQYGPELLNMSNKITDTTKANIRQILIDGVNNDLTLNQITDRIKQEAVTPARARVIARTETVRAANAGAMVNANDKGYVLQKKWFSVMDNRTRHDHETLDGQVVDKDQPFTVVDKEGITQKLMFPGDTSFGASPAETINCRCSMQFLAKPEAQKKPKKEPVKPVEPVVEPKPEETIEANTIKEAEAITQRLMQQVKGVSIDYVRYNKTLTLDVINLYNKQLNYLLKKYSPFEYPESNAYVTFNSTSKEYGAIGKYSISGKLAYANFGHEIPKILPPSSRASFVEEDVTLTTTQKRLKLSESSTVDEINKNKAVLTHEFAHLLSSYTVNPKGNKIEHNKFWEEIFLVRKRYIDDVMNAVSNNDENRLDEIFIGQYANTNVDEFMAESFTEYELSSSPSPYAVEVGNIILKYFGNASR